MISADKSPSPRPISYTHLRLDSLGDGYTLEDLLAVLAGQKEHTPRQKPVKQADPSKVNLLVDIQAKLQAGKGAGYVRWAKVFNLKPVSYTHLLF